MAKRRPSGDGAEWLEQWLGQMSTTLRPGTLESYQRDMENHVIPYLGQKMLTQITAAGLRKLYDTLQKNGRVNPRPDQNRGLSSTTVHGIHTTLHHALRAAVEQRGSFLPTPLMRKIVLPPSIRFHDQRHPNVKPETENFYSFLRIKTRSLHSF